MLPRPAALLDRPTDASAPDPLVIGGDDRARCGWVRADPVLTAFHDDEWGVPLHGDAALFERLSLETFQSGLSWLVVLRRRAAFRAAFAGFEPAAVARFGDAEVDALLADEGLVRNRRKLEAVIGNARAVATLVERDGPDALDTLVWSHAPALRAPGDRPTRPEDVPASTAEAGGLADALHEAGLRFVGPLTSYALMQSAGLVDDHLAGCWRA